MSTDRKALDMNFDALDDFEPAQSSRDKPRVTREEVNKVSGFPSREGPQEGQLSIKSPDRQILERFKKMCKADRRAYYDMLEILMDHFEGKS